MKKKSDRIGTKRKSEVIERKKNKEEDKKKSSGIRPSSEEVEVRESAKRSRSKMEKTA